MNSLIEVLARDEPLCNVLSSEPGRRWLSDKAYREETRETFQEEEAPLEAPRPAGKAKKGLERREFDIREVDLDQVIRGLKMIEIPAGKFQMGSEKGEDWEKPVHAVQLDGFEISATPISQAQYEAVMGRNPSRFEGPDRPVEQVSWEDAMVFCEQLTNKAKVAGQRFILPTEAQWEYACRAGTDTEYSFADDEKDLGKYVWFEGNSSRQTQPVGQKEPNKWGLYDMHGNVWEWCLDWFADDYYGKSPEKNPEGPDAGSGRVCRGGGWNDSPRSCRSAYRNWDAPSFRRRSLGFRVARSFVGKQAESDT